MAKKDPLEEYLASLGRVLGNEPETPFSVVEQVPVEPQPVSSLPQSKPEPVRAEAVPAQAVKAAPAEIEPEQSQQVSRSRYVYSSSQILDEPLRLSSREALPIAQLPDTVGMEQLVEMYEHNSKKLFDDIDDDIPNDPKLFDDATRLDYGESDEDTELVQPEPLETEQPKPAHYEMKPQQQAVRADARSDAKTESDSEEDPFSLFGGSDDIKVAIYPTAQFGNEQFPSIADLPYAFTDLFGAPPSQKPARSDDYKVEDVIAATDQLQQAQKSSRVTPDSSDQDQGSFARVMADRDHLPLSAGRFSRDGELHRCVFSCLDASVIGYDIARLIRRTALDVVAAEAECKVDGDSCAISFSRDNTSMKATVEATHGGGVLSEVMLSKGTAPANRVRKLNKASSKVFKEECDVLPYEALGDLLPEKTVVDFARLTLACDGNRYMIVIAAGSPDAGVSWEGVDDRDALKEFAVALSADLADCARRRGTPAAKPAPSGGEGSFFVDGNGRVMG